MASKVENLDDSQIQNSITLKIMTQENSNLLDEEIVNRITPLTDLLAKKLVVCLIGRQNNFLNQGVSDIISDSVFIKSILNGMIDFDRLKVLLKFKLDSRVDKSLDEQIRNGILPYSDLKNLYFNLRNNHRFYNVLNLKIYNNRSENECEFFDFTEFLEHNVSIYRNYYEISFDYVLCLFKPDEYLIEFQDKEDNVNYKNDYLICFKISGGIYNQKAFFNIYSKLMKY